MSAEANEKAPEPVIDAENIQFDDTGDEPVEEAAPVETPQEKGDAPEEPTGEGEETEPAPAAKVTFDEDQQRIFNTEIAKKTAKIHEAARRAEEAEARAAELEAKIPKPQAPAVPPMPDPFEDGYEEKVKSRDQAMLKYALYDAQQKAQQYAQQQQQKAAQEAEMAALTKTVESYTERAGKLNIKPEELQAAGNMVATANLPNEIVHHILNEEKGPAITKYLAAHPMELEKIAEMSPMRAAIYLETHVKTALANQGTTKPPAPTDTIRGAGVPEGSRGPKGATYE